MPDSRFPDYDVLLEPQLLFDPVDANQRSNHPSEGCSIMALTAGRSPVLCVIRSA